MHRSAARPATRVRCPRLATARALAGLLAAAAASALAPACSLYDSEAEGRDQARYSRDVAVILRAMAPGRQACYDASPSARARRASTVVASWFVDDRGRATEVIVDAAPPDPTLARCYNDLIARQRFPVGNAGWRSRMEQRHDPP